MMLSGIHWNIIMIEQTKISLIFSRWFGVIELVIIIAMAGITYLPNLSQATIYRDDWYYTLDRSIGGPGTFEAMFSIDRPARGPFFEAYYQLFGTEPLPYHLMSLAWRLLSGLAGLWLFRLLWPQQRAATLFMALLLMLYAGYFRWMEGFESQPHLASLCFEVLSIALTIKAIQTGQRYHKIAYWVGSILTGWIYMALVDYAIGMEAFRLLCVGLVIWPRLEGKSILRRGLAVLRIWCPALLIAGGFLFWHTFIFTNIRPDTDPAIQLNVLAQSPLTRGFWWLVYFFQSILDVGFLAWSGPYALQFFGLSAEKIAMGFALAGLMICCAMAALLGAEHKEQAQMDGEKNTNWPLQAVVVGLLGVMGGVVPVVMANRRVVFAAFSHYGLPASLASAVVAGSLVFLLRPRWARIGAGILLVFLAFITHFAYGTGINHEEQIIAAFWQQVAWRAPDIQPETTLMVSYPEINYGEDVDAAGGPANFIYYPETTHEIPARYPLFALQQMPWISKEVITGGHFERDYRTHEGVVDYNQLLVISQPDVNACIHVQDSRWPWTSYDERDAILISAKYSQSDRIIATGEVHSVPDVLGSEPPHGWCYYFEKAELAVQMNDWQAVMQLEQMVSEQDLRPVNELEWMPFAQAAAVTGSEELFRQAVSRMASSLHNRTQGCRVMQAMQLQGIALNAEMTGLVNDLLCNGLYR